MKCGTANARTLSHTVHVYVAYVKHSPQTHDARIRRANHTQLRALNPCSRAIVRELFYAWHAAAAATSCCRKMTRLWDALVRRRCACAFERQRLSTISPYNYPPPTISYSRQHSINPSYLLQYVAILLPAM